MLAFQFDPVTVVMAVSAFGLVFAIWLFCTLWWVRRRVTESLAIQERLDPDSNQSAEARTLRLWHEGEETTTTVVDDKGKSGMWVRFRELCARAGWEDSVQSVALGVCLASFTLAALLWVLTQRMLPAAMGVVAVVMVFMWVANLRAARRRKIYERQLVDGLELSARALRAGHPLLSSFHLIAEEIPAPVGKVFADICQKHEMGVDLESGLRRAANETDSPDMRLFSASLAINLRTGGNMAEVVDGLAAVIRERMRLSRRFRILVAQTQLSKRILIAMPILMFVMLNTLKPDYMEPLYETSRGQSILLFAGLSLCSGWWMMNKMASLHS